MVEIKPGLIKVLSDYSGIDLAGQYCKANRMAVDEAIRVLQRLEAEQELEKANTSPSLAEAIKSLPEKELGVETKQEIEKLRKEGIALKKEAIALYESVKNSSEAYAKAAELLATITMNSSINIVSHGYIKFDASAWRAECLTVLAEIERNK